jgi:hypothetical protein
MRGRHRRPMLTVRGEYAVIARQVHPRLRHAGRFGAESRGEPDPLPRSLRQSTEPS